MASQSDPTDLPPNAAQLREQLVAATQTFFDSHGIRVKSRKLPVPLPATSPPAPVSSRAEGSGSARKASGRAQVRLKSGLVGKAMWRSRFGPPLSASVGVIQRSSVYVVLE